MVLFHEIIDFHERKKKDFFFFFFKGVSRLGFYARMHVVSVHQVKREEVW